MVDISPAKVRAFRAARAAGKTQKEAYAAATATPMEAATLEKQTAFLQKAYIAGSIPLTEAARHLREGEHLAGARVHSIAYHTKQMQVGKEATSKGGSLPVEMTPTEAGSHSTLRKAGAGIAEAAAVANLAAEGQEGIYRGTSQTWMVTKEGVRKVTGEDIAGQVGSLSLTPEATGETARRYEEAQLGFTRTLPVKTVGGRVVYDIDKIKASPALLKLYSKEVPGAIEALAVEYRREEEVKVAPIDTREFEYQQAQKQRRRFEKAHTEVVKGSGNWVENKWLAQLKIDDPTGYYILTVRGVKAAEARIRARGTAISRLKPYTDKDGNVDGAGYLRDNPGKGQTLKDAGFIPAQVVGWAKYNAEVIRLITVIEEGRFTPLQAETLVDAISAAGYRRKTKLGYLVAKEWNTLTNEEKARVALIYKGIEPSPMHTAEMLVPSVYVTKNWTTLSTKEKVINIATDVASVIVVVGIFKAVGITARITSGVAKTTKLAAKAGKAGRDLRQVTATFASYQKVGKMGSPLWVKHANAVTKARQVSMKADRMFLESLQRLQTISPRQLKQLAKVSDLRGIDSAIVAVTKSQRELAKVWKALGKLRYYTNPKTAKQIAANERYLRASARVEKAQVKLQFALDNAGSTLRPRYTPSPEAPEFKGYRVRYKYTLEKKPVVNILDPKTARAIDKGLVGEVKPLKTKVIVAEKVKAPAWTMEMKAAYAKGKPKPKPEIKVPAVEEFKRQVAAALKKVPREVAVTAIPSEAFGRMTYAQIAKHYGTEDMVDAVSSTLIDFLAKYKELVVVTPAIRTRIREIASAGIEAQIKAMQKGLTASQVRASVQEAIRTRVKAIPALATLVEPLTKQMVRTTTKVVTRTVVTTKIAARPTPKVPPVMLRPPRLPMSDKQKRKVISEGKGAFAFRMGELGKERDVWYSYISPYNKPEHRIVVVGKAPRGALIVRGPGSAIKTAQMLYGKALKEKRTDDIGFMDAIFEPMLRRKGIRLSFKPDPKQETIGDFGTPFRLKKAEPISPRVGSITDRRARLSGGRGIRITPKVGRLR